MKVTGLLVCLAFLFSGRIHAQEAEPLKSDVEIMPSYPGGIEEMYKFIYSNLKYPVAARKMKIQGQVITQFVVDKEGYLKDIKVVRGVDPSLDNEARRVIELMNEGERWNPGIHNGEPMDVVFTFPLRFVIQ
jgi:periplasmic protein TonB